MKYIKVSLNVVLKDLPILTQHNVTVLPLLKVLKLTGIQSHWHTDEAI